MSTQHTPGPLIAKELHVNSNSAGSAITFPIKGGTRRLDDGKGAFSNEDARLIAAAPELLEALKRLMFDATHAIHDASMGTALLENECRNAAALIFRVTHGGSFAPSEDAARAAIAKATGGSAK